MRPINQLQQLGWQLFFCKSPDYQQLSTAGPLNETPLKEKNKDRKSKQRHSSFKAIQNITASDTANFSALSTEEKLSCVLGERERTAQLAAKVIFRTHNIRNRYIK